MAFVLIICNGIPEPPKFNKQSNERCAPFPLLFETRRRPPKHEKRYGKRKTVPNERFPHGETHQGRTDAARPKHPWLAQQVGCSRENLYKVFRHKWIYTDLLFQISEALDYDFFKLCSDYYQAKKCEKTNQ